MIPFTLNTRNRQILRERNTLAFSRGQGSESRLGKGVISYQVRAFFWEDEKVSKQSYRDMLAIQHNEYIKPWSNIS